MTDFGITPTQIAQISADWRAAGESIRAVATPPPATDGRSRAVAAALAFSHRVHEVATADGDRLVALGDALAVFNATTVASDAASAAALGQTPRSVR